MRCPDAIERSCDVGHMNSVLAATTRLAFAERVGRGLVQR